MVQCTGDLIERINTLHRHFLPPNGCVNLLVQRVYICFIYSAGFVIVINLVDNHLCGNLLDHCDN